MIQACVRASGSGSSDVGFREHALRDEHGRAALRLVSTHGDYFCNLVCKLRHRLQQRRQGTALDLHRDSDHTKFAPLQPREQLRLFTLKCRQVQ